MAGTDKSFITKYRPNSFDTVLGHEEALRSLQRALANTDRPHCFLLTGPSGTGKTTIARIIGNELDADVQEIDAPSYSGVENARELVGISQYMSMSGKGNRLYIIDECHSLSKAAWQALLKLTEEPPDHFYVALCTTEPDKVPVTIAQQRAFPIQLRPLPVPLIEGLLQFVCENENWRVADDVFASVLQGADGSPRKALTLLLALHDCIDREEVRRVVLLQDDNDAVIQLCQLFVRTKPTWDSVKPILAKIQDDEFQSAPVLMGRYLVKVMLSSKDANIALRINILLNALVFPSETFDPKIRFIAAIGRMVWPQ